jgi:LacI family transcriptional regulator
VLLNQENREIAEASEQRLQNTHDSQEIVPLSRSREDASDIARPRPTMQDVARSAGVSLKTVSRVVNNEPRVDEKTKERVNEAIALLAFRRNDLARNLRRGQSSSTVGLVIEDITNPFYSGIARGLEKVAQRYNYMLVISNSEEKPVRERELVNALIRRRVEGLCIVPAGLDHSYLTTELRMGTPVLFLDRPPIRLQTDTIVLDNRGGAYRAIQHLVAYGHRRIAMIQGDPQVYTGAERFRGYCEALKDHGILYDPDLLRLGCDDAVQAAAATHALLALADPPTAIFTASNRISIAVLRALRAYSQRLAFVGFDDFELAEMLPLPVTVVAHDPIAMGCQAAELLFARLNGDNRPPQNLVFPTGLIARGSGEVPPYRS